MLSNNNSGRVCPYYLCLRCNSNKNKVLKTVKPIYIHFLEFLVEQVLKSFSVRNNPLEPMFLDALTSSVSSGKQSRELLILISWVSGY